MKLRQDSADKRAGSGCMARLVGCSSCSCSACLKNRKSLLEKLSLLEGAEFKRHLFYRDAHEIFRMMEHEVCPENTHDGSSFGSDSGVGVNTVRHKKFVAGRAKFMNGNRVVLAISVLKKVL